MLTTNPQKKELVQRLVDSKIITIEDAYLLLDDGVNTTINSYPVIPPIISQPIIQPYTWPIGPYYSSGSITIGGNPTFTCSSSYTNISTIPGTITLCNSIN